MFHPFHVTFIVILIAPVPGPFVTQLQLQAGRSTAVRPNDDGLWTRQHNNCSAWLDDGPMSALIPTSSLFVNKLSCLAIRGPLGFFNPSNRRSYSTVFVASLLLIAGVECNPGPSVRHCGDVTLGCMNICSCVRRAALVHTTIADYKLDIMALQETWIEADDPAAVRQDIAPSGYNVIHAHRPLPADDTRGSRQQTSRSTSRRHQGLAVIYRNGLDVTSHRLQSSTAPSTFDCQLVTVKSGKSSNVIVVNLYRKPDPAVASQLFFDELSDLISIMSTSSGGEVVVCGDLNCCGDD